MRASKNRAGFLLLGTLGHEDFDGKDFLIPSSLTITTEIQNQPGDRHGSYRCLPPPRSVKGTGSRNVGRIPSSELAGDIPSGGRR